MAWLPWSRKKPLTNFIFTTSRGATTLHDRETKQVEFVHAENMFAPTIYVYDGASGYRFSGGLNTAQGYGITGNKKVMVMREFVNAETNHLGVAAAQGPAALLPARRRQPVAICRRKRN